MSGITEQMLVDYIEEFLGRKVSALDRYPIILVFDRAPIHNSERVLEAFHSVGCEEVQEVVKMPAQGAKRISPLDNGLFHLWKEKVRLHSPLTEKNIISAMNKEWLSLSQQNIKSAYHHCGLVKGTDPYKDCPNPKRHKH